MTATRLVRAGCALAFGHLVMRGTRSDADLYDRVGATVLLACLAVDVRREDRELGHHHQALQALARRQDRTLGLLGEHRH
jgi:hypothetical protein